MGKSKRKNAGSSGVTSEPLYRSARERVERHVAGELARDRSPMGLIRLALAAERSCEDSTRSFDGRAMAQLDCKGGCDFCCYPPVSATVPEVANIVAFLFSQLPEAEQDRLIGRVGEVFIQVNGMSGAERASQNVACPYLLEGRCSIYPVRPLACRGFNSSSRSACAGAFAERGSARAVPAYIPLLATAQGLKEGLAAGLERAGLPGPLVDLVRASHKLLNELDDNLWEWLEGKDVFADCRPF